MQNKQKKHTECDVVSHRCGEMTRIRNDGRGVTEKVYIGNKGSEHTTWVIGPGIMDGAEIIERVCSSSLVETLVCDEMRWVTPITQMKTCLSHERNGHKKR